MENENLDEMFDALETVDDETDKPVEQEEVKAEPEPEAEETEKEEEQEEEKPTDDDEETEEITVFTVNGEEIQIPANTPEPILAAVKAAEKNLIAGFQQKTMALAEERKQIPEQIASGRAEALEQAKTVIQRSQAMLEQTAQLYSDQQIDQLYRDAPEQGRLAERHNAKIRQSFAALNEQYDQIEANLKQAKEEEANARAQRTLADLDAANFDLSGLQPLFQSVAKHYKIADKDYFKNVLDAPQILMMADAVKWQELNQEKLTTTKRVAKTTKAAPRKGATPPKTQRLRDIDGRFAPGKNPTHDDVAEWLAEVNF